MARSAAFQRLARTICIADVVLDFTNLRAGEHTSSFCEWQGFTEGGAVSGLRAAAEAL